LKLLKKIKSFFERNLSFEHGVDLNDEVEVLFRRNIVIKNIILISNMVYSVILFLVSYGDPSNGNWLWSVIPFPLTFVINHTIKKVIYAENKDLIRQQIAMYMCSFYMFLSAILVYIKLKSGANTVAYSEAGYMLLYYSLVVISLYQDTKMLKNVFGWMFAIVTVLHFTMTHSLVDYASDGFMNFINNITKNEVLLVNLKDIVFRTLVMLIFMLAIYIITAIGAKMNNERVTELNKRKEIQEDFKNVVTNLYDVLLQTKVGYDDNSAQLPLLAKMAAKLASLYSLSPQKCEEITGYVLYNKHHQLNLSMEASNTEAQFDKLREQTSIGYTIAKRMQLSQKCENIVRAHIEGWSTQEFQIKMLNMQNNIESQIILICDMYITLRSVKSYKRPYPHKYVIENLEKEFKIYFNSDLFERFIKFEKDFELMYNDYEVM
jgi:hypothetical protein